MSCTLYSVHCIQIPPYFTSCQFWPIYGQTGSLTKKSILKLFIFSGPINSITVYIFRAHLPGVYTNIANYIDWVAETLY